MGGNRYLTLRQVQRELRLTGDEVATLVETGELPAFSVLGHLRVERGALEQFVRRCYVPSPEAGGSEPTVRCETLTRQQRAILALLADGRSNVEIAEKLTVEVSTVKSHVSRLLQRFDLRDREQLIAFAWRTGMVGPSGVPEIGVE